MKKNRLESILKFRLVRTITTLVSLVLSASCSTYESISRPAILGDFRIYTSSGKEVNLKSSKISADADEVSVLSHEEHNDFEVNGIRYFVIKIGYYENSSHIFVNSKNGKTLYVDDFYQMIITSKAEVFIVTVGNEAYSADSGIIIFALNSEGDIEKKFQLKGLFEDLSKIKLEDDGNFYFEAKQVSISDLKFLKKVSISYKDRKFSSSILPENKGVKSRHSDTIKEGVKSRHSDTKPQNLEK